MSPDGQLWRNNDHMSVDVNIFMKLYDQMESEWVEVSKDYIEGNISEQNYDGISTVTLDGAVFFSNARYLLELRSTCKQEIQGREVIFQSRSGVRLGISDTDGPQLITWTNVIDINLDSGGIPIAYLAFDGEKCYFYL